MAQLIVRNLDEALKAKIQIQANVKGISMEEMVSYFGRVTHFLLMFSPSNQTNALMRFCLTVKFDDASKFNQPIGGWNVSSVTDMAKMVRTW